MIRIDLKKLSVFLLLLPIFRINSITNTPVLWTFFNVYTYLSIGLLLLMYLQKRRSPSYYVLIFTIFLILIGLSNTHNGLGVMKVFTEQKLFILLLLIVDFYRFELKTLIEVIYSCLEFLIYSNFLTVIFFPQGLFSRYTEAYGYTQEWLLGAKNDFIRYFLPALLISLIYRVITKKVLRTNLLGAVILASLIFQASSTTIVGTSLFLLFINLGVLKPLLSPTRATLAIWGSFLMIVVFRAYSFLEPIVVGLLGKNLTFSNRTTIWDNALWHIKDNLFQGYGMVDIQTMVSMLGTFPNGWIWKGATHAHNHFLQLLLWGGLPTLVIFALLMHISMFRARYSSFSKWLNAACLTTGIIMITEVFNNPLIYLIFFLSFYLVDSKSQFISPKVGV